MGFLDGSEGEEPTCNAGDSGDSDLIPEWGRSLEESMATHCSILARKFPWTEEPDWLWSMGLQRVRHN